MASKTFGFFFFFKSSNNNNNKKLFGSGHEHFLKNVSKGLFLFHLISLVLLEGTVLLCYDSPLCSSLNECNT